MALDELYPILRALSRHDKFLALQFVVTELMSEEGLESTKSSGESMWELHNSAETADALTQVLESEKEEALA